MQARPDEQQAVQSGSLHNLTEFQAILCIPPDKSMEMQVLSDNFQRRGRLPDAQEHVS